MIEIIKLLINNGADVNIKDGTGKTVWDYAVKQQGEQNSEIIEYLRSLRVRNGTEIAVAKASAEEKEEVCP